MKKKFSYSILTISLLLTYLFSNVALASSDYSGGVLDGRPATIHPGVLTSVLGTDTNMTDNNINSYKILKPSFNLNDLTNESNAIVDLGADYTITDFIQLSDAKLEVTLLDKNKNIIGSTFTTSPTTVKTSLSQAYKHVRYVNWGNYTDSMSTPANKVYEFNVYGFLEVPPEGTINLTAAAGNMLVTLNWTAVSGSNSYIIKRSTTPGGPYNTVGSASTNIYVDTTVTNGTTYYYIVTPVNEYGEGETSNEASATPQAALLGRALLTIYISGGQIKEYDLSMAEVNAFISWYDAKDAGTGSAKYKFVKTWNKGPFKARSEYVIFDKILTFDVDEYDVVNP